MLSKMSTNYLKMQYTDKMSNLPKNVLKKEKYSRLCYMIDGKYFRSNQLTVWVY